MRQLLTSEYSSAKTLMIKVSDKTEVCVYEVHVAS